MTIKKSIPAILLLVGLVWTGILSMPGGILSAPPVPPGAAGSIAGVDTKTEPIFDGKGNTVGTKTTTQRGTTSTETEVYTAGVTKGRTVTNTYNSKGETVAQSIKNADGSSSTVVIDRGVSTATETRADGTVYTQKIALPGGEWISSSVSRPNGPVVTTTYDAKRQPVLLTIKDKDGNVTTALPDGKGGFASVVKGEKGRVINTTYDTKGQPTFATVKDKKGKVVSTTTTTYDGKGGYTSVTRDKKGKLVSTTTSTSDGKGGLTSVTKDKKGKVVSTTVYDKDGKVVAQSGKKQTLTAEGGDTSSSGKKVISGIGPGQGKPETLKGIIPDRTQAFSEKVKSSHTDWSSTKASSSSSTGRAKLLKQNTDWGSTKASSGSGASRERLMKQNTDWGSTKASSGFGASSEKLMKQQNTDWGATKATSGSGNKNKALQMHNRRR